MTTPATITLAEAAAHFCVPLSTMRTASFRAKLVVAGLRTARVGRRVLVRQDSIQACLENLRTHPQWGPGRKAVRK